MPPIILGQSPFISHYVGGVANSPTLFNQCYLQLILLPDDAGPLLAVDVQLLGGGRLGMYQAVVGRVTDISRVLALCSEAGAN